VSGNKDTHLQKLQYLQNGALILYEIFIGYYDENFLLTEHVLCSTTGVCEHGASFNALFLSERASTTSV